MKKGVLSFHQDWTDLINRLSLIDYYSTIYQDLTVILRTEAKPIYEFYLRDKPHINKVYRNNICGGSKIDLNEFNENEYDYLLHDKFDCNRIDQYKNAFSSIPIPIPEHYNKLVYTCYDIDYITKVDYFRFTRDYKLEVQIYDEFINKYGSDYILYHDNMLGDSDMSFERKEKEVYVNLNGINNNPFAMIKVLIHAKEIHLVDSFWASFCYSIDAKYNLLQNIKIYLYPFIKKGRWGGILKDKSYELKLEPVLLPNWIIKR
jgi:hypothetical protein